MALDMVPEIYTIKTVPLQQKASLKKEFQEPRSCGLCLCEALRPYICVIWIPQPRREPEGPCERLRRD